MASMAAMAALMQNTRLPDVTPEVVKLPPPPAFTGPLAPNNLLALAEKHAFSNVIGPESMVVVQGYVYTGLANGFLVEVRPDGSARKILRMSRSGCERLPSYLDLCGRPLGVRVDNNRYLIVADAYSGIYRVNPGNGTHRQLVNPRRPINGRPIGFINDLALAKDGTIYFTSSSSIYNRTQYLDIIMHGETTGRVLVYRPYETEENRVQELMTKLHFANGIELSKDESYLLVAEGGRARIHRVWLGPVRLEKFADNLPGFVDNIRRTSRGTYWVAISSIRSKEKPSVLDQYGSNVQIRRAIWGLPREEVKARSPNYGLIVELNDKGQIIRSLHDQNGTVFTAVSEVQEDDQYLYIGSFDRPYVGRISLKDLAENQRPQGPISPMQRFLDMTMFAVRRTHRRQTEDFIIFLLRQLIEFRLQAIRAMKRIEKLHKDLEATKRAILASKTPKPDIPTINDQALTTTVASPTTTAEDRTTTAEAATTTAEAARTTTEAATTTVETQTATSEKQTTAENPTTTAENPTTTTENPTTAAENPTTTAENSATTTTAAAPFE